MLKTKKRIVSGMEVVLTTGDKEYRGKKFIVESVLDDYVTLKNYKKLKKFIKPNPEQGNENFKLIDKKVHISNVAAVDNDGKISKIGFKIESDGIKKRIYKTTKSEASVNIQKKSVKK